MKISKVYIKSFRGIPNECTLNFCDNKGKPKSVIIYGGNGSGKSSIVDAIEFNLQGRIERSTTIYNPKRPIALNLFPENNINAYTEITFNDNTINERNIIVEENNFNFTSNALNDNFKETPIALRRNDIIYFNIAKEEQRQYFISEFLYSQNSEVKSELDPDVINLDRKKARLQTERDKKVELLKIILPEINEWIGKKLLVYDLFGHYYTYKGGQKIGLTKTGEIKRILEKKEWIKYEKIAKEIDDYKSKLEKIQEKIKHIREVRKRENLTPHLKPFCEKAEKYLTEAFKRISNVDYVEDIKLSIGMVAKNSLNIDVILKNKRIVSPSEIFSEANYDLMVLLFYLSIIRVGAEYGQSKVLIIDDVLQSVDASIRTRFMSYILQELKDWQIIITCHDRLWLAQLKHLFKRNGISNPKEFHITNWSFETGPIIREEKTNVTDESIQQAFGTNNMRIISSTAGFMLEKICNELTMNMHFSIERPYGDKYELENLWNVVKARLQKDDKASLICKELDNVYYLRNTHGAHYNQWAESVNDEEVIKFANLVQELYNITFCNKCYSWIKKDYENKEYGKCMCGKTIVKINLKNK